mgnify:CR=1 FL=1
MGRPIYESGRNSEAERRLAISVASIGSYGALKMPKLSALDWLFFRGSDYRFCEIKCRSNPVRLYPTLMVSKEKMERGRIVSEALKIPARLVIGWIDFVGWIPIDEKPESIGEGGRVDRGDSMDIELCAFYRIDQFREIKVAPPFEKGAGG